ncbi:MAG: DUF1080 domain-containing protein [Kiritimatiellia bacterium]|jgi:hypothetical protein|nr:DUF1080 domain-containing protein [Kiritimatiellia bacterium]
MKEWLVTICYFTALTLTVNAAGVSLKRGITANGAGYPNEGPNCVADGNVNTKYCNKSSSIWLQYSYGDKKTMFSYSIISANDPPERDPKDWKLFGSNDGQKWTELDSRSGESFAGRFTKKTFIVKKPGDYSVYKLDVTANHGADIYQLAELSFSERRIKEPKRSEAPKAVTKEKPFNGQNLDGWIATGERGQNMWKVGTAQVSLGNPMHLVVKEGGNELVNAPPGHGKSRNFYSEATHGDALIELELMVPKSSNSGIYVHGNYEIQVLDSYGRKKLGMGDMGAIFGAQPPKMNACKKPGEWQKYEIYFHAPEFDEGGKKIKNAFFERVILNGKLIQENIEMEECTPGSVDGKEKPEGPIMFQGDHGPVAYRNIVIKPLPK